MADELISACFQHSESSLLGGPEATAIIVAIIFYKNSVIAIYLSFLEDGLKVVVVMEIELSRPMRPVVPDPTKVHPTLLEDVHLYGLEAVLLQLQRIIYTLYFRQQLL